MIKAVVMGRPVELVEQNKLWQGTLIAQGEGKMLVTKPAARLLMAGWEIYWKNKNGKDAVAEKD